MVRWPKYKSMHVCNVPTLPDLYKVQPQIDGTQVINLKSIDRSIGT